MEREHSHVPFNVDIWVRLPVAASAYTACVVITHTASPEAAAHFTQLRTANTTAGHMPGTRKMRDLSCVVLKRSPRRQQPLETRQPNGVGFYTVTSRPFLRHTIEEENTLTGTVSGCKAASVVYDHSSAVVAKIT